MPQSESPSSHYFGMYILEKHLRTVLNALAVREVAPCQRREITSPAPFAMPLFAVSYHYVQRTDANL